MKQAKKLKKELTSEQQKALKAEETRQRKLVKDVLYPYVLANSKSIEDAKNLLYACHMAVQQAFQKKVMEEQVRLSKEKVAFLELETIIAIQPEFARDKGLLDLVTDEKISTADSLLGGLKTAIESFQREEGTKRGLDTLTTEFL